MNKFAKLSVGCLVVGAMALASTAFAAFDGTGKLFGVGPNGAVEFQNYWAPEHGVGASETQLSLTGNPLAGTMDPVATVMTGSLVNYGDSYLSRRSAGTGLGSGGQIWLNIGNTAFWNTMKTTSIAAANPTPWFSWTERVQDQAGIRQNDMVVNGVGSLFGGDRIGIGENFAMSYDVSHKGTGVGSRSSNVNNTGDVSVWQTANGYDAGDIYREDGTYNGLYNTTGAPYQSQSGDIVTWILGKRADGTTDVWLNSPQILTADGWLHYSDTMSNDNPEWYFYGIEFRGNNGNLVTWAPDNTTTDMLAFSYGNNWDGTWAPPPVPEPASLALLLVGGVTIMARRRKA